MPLLRPLAALLLCAAALIPATRKPDPKVSTKASTSELQTAQRWMRSMSLREIAAQLLVIPCYGDSPNSRSKAYQKFVREVRDLGVGGLIVNNRVQGGLVRNAEPHAMAAFFNRMQRYAKTP